MLHPQFVIFSAAIGPEYALTNERVFANRFGLQYLHESALHLMVDDTEYLLEGCWFWPVYPGPRYRYGPPAGKPHYNHRFFTVSGRQAELWAETGLFAFAPQQVAARQHYDERMRLLIELGMLTDPLSQVRFSHQVEALLIELAERRATSEGVSGWLAQVYAVLNRPETLSPDYRQLAEECEMSLRTLRRRFLDATGLTLHDYYLQQKMQHARRLMLTTMLSLKQIALQLGYEDYAYFSRQFRSLVGMTPRAYRQRNLLA